MKVLILCTANSCRSQMAHGFLQALDSSLQVFSAGIHASGQIHPKAALVMAESGIPIMHHTSEPVEKYINEDWDFVITVCGGANEKCPIFRGHTKHRLHIGFDDPSDAIGSEDFVMNEFRRVRDLIKQKMQEFYVQYIV